MRLLIVAVAFIAVLFAGSAGAQDQLASASPSQISFSSGDAKPVHMSDGKVMLAKVKWRRTCPADQMRCACADTGTSACCTANQRCACSPTAVCR